MSIHDRDISNKENSQKKRETITANIPNVLFDIWMSKLSPDEFKVLMSIAYHTYGLHLEYAFMTLKQIEKTTNLKDYEVQRAIQILFDYAIINKIIKDTEEGYEISYDELQNLEIK